MGSDEHSFAALHWLPLSVQCAFSVHPTHFPLEQYGVVPEQESPSQGSAGALVSIMSPLALKASAAGVTSCIWQIRPVGDCASGSSTHFEPGGQSDDCAHAPLFPGWKDAFSALSVPQARANIESDRSVVFVAIFDMTDNSASASAIVIATHTSIERMFVIV